MLSRVSYLAICPALKASLPCTFSAAASDIVLDFGGLSDCDLMSGADTTQRIG